jgi:hypothetical protein
LELDIFGSPGSTSPPQTPTPIPLEQEISGDGIDNNNNVQIDEGALQSLPGKWRLSGAHFD